jgi:hypothetical protein
MLVLVGTLLPLKYIKKDILLSSLQVKIIFSTYCLLHNLYVRKYIDGTNYVDFNF